MKLVTVKKIRDEFARSGMPGLVRASLNRPFRWIKAFWQLSKKRTFDSSSELLAYARSIGDGWFNPMQLDKEVLALLDRIRKLRPRTVLEIGTANGGTLLMFTKLSTTDALLIGIDLPGGSFGGGYPSWRAPLYKKFACCSQRIVLFRGNSHEEVMFKKVNSVLKGRMIDLLFIDGDHSYNGVKRDYHMYRSLVRKGGLIALHDIAPSKDPRCQVPYFWNEIRRETTSEALVESEEKGYGIGLIWV